MIELKITPTLYIKSKDNKRLIIFVARKDIIRHYKYNYTYNTLIKKVHQIATQYSKTVYKTGITPNDSIIQIYATYNDKYLYHKLIYKI